MCGIVGWINPALTDRAASLAMARGALDALGSRGPDGARLEWSTGWILGHRRLAIIDLSHRASQPMTDGRGSWLVYNGEIYNFPELREELRGHGHEFLSQGDAEVLLRALQYWGVGCLERLRGMFAFCLLDSERRELILARDRYGVKPLAYEIQGNEFRFASDLFALRALPRGDRNIDAESAFLYMALGYVPAPHSIHPRVRKVKPGHYLRVRWSDAGLEEVREHRYWSIRAMDETEPSPQDGAAQEYERRAQEAIRYRLVSDVPVGTLLSGGIDSTLVTALGRELGKGGLPSFTLGFDDPAFDEAPFARSIAQDLGGDHNEFQLTEEVLEDAWRRLWTVYDEPFADVSAVPTLALARFVAPHVKVALTGDGGDEVFCGYPWHANLDRLSRLLSARSLDPTETVRLGRFRLRHRLASDQMLDRAALWSILRTGLSDGMARGLPVAEGAAAAALSDYFREWSMDLASIQDSFEWAGRMDLLTYLPDDLMVKSDRAGMGAGLELREPLLDHELTAWVLRSPVSVRYDRATETSKLLPRALLRRRLSGHHLDRPKQGFTPPYTAWLAGPLSEVVDDALHRLERGELEPVVLPAASRNWSDCAESLNDQEKHFLWRIVSLSEWMKHVRAAA